MEFFRAVESRRVYIFTAENGGLEKDGMILIRPGIEDVSIGDRKYAAVRIAVDFKYQLRGMAIYSNDIPDGFDIAVYTRHSTFDLMGDYNKQFSTIVPIKDMSNPFDYEVIDIPGSKVYVVAKSEHMFDYTQKMRDSMAPWDREMMELKIAEVAVDCVDDKLTIEEAREKIKKIREEFK